MQLRIVLPTLASLASLALPALAAVPAPTEITVHVDRHRVLTVSKLALGCTRTERDLDNVVAAPGAAERAEALIDPVTRYMNAHIFYWGCANPEPSPGVYDWKSLDKRIAMIRAARAEPIITLCGAPDWMKGGVAGQSDPKILARAPTPDHYADFAALAKTIAQRYPDVLHFQVWNEFKGLWDKQRNNWDYIHYTEMYNTVYDALKSVNPKIQVGGPYLVLGGDGADPKGGSGATDAPILPSNQVVLDYWLAHKHGADMFLVDRGLIDYHDHVARTLDEKLALTHTYEDIPKQIHTKTDLPVWFSEYYIGTPAETLPDSDVVHASVLYHMLLGGVSVALMWQPMESGNKLQGLFTDVRKPDGGQPTPFYHPYAIFSRYFGPGTKIYTTTVSSPGLEVLASAAETLLINKTSAAVDVRLDGHDVPLKPYEVRVVDAAK